MISIQYKHFYSYCALPSKCIMFFFACCLLNNYINAVMCEDINNRFDICGDTGSRSVDYWQIFQSNLVIDLIFCTLPYPNTI